MDAEFVQISGTPPVQASPPRPPVEKKPNAPPQSDQPKKTEDADTVTLSNEGRVAAENRTPDAGGATNAERHFDVTSGQVILKIVDSSTSRVVKQIPPEEQIRLQHAIQESVKNLAKGKKTLE